jgi:hypothetical protein
MVATEIPAARHPARLRGLTLVELMVAATISAMVIAAVLSVLLQTLKVYSYENGQTLLNQEIRKFTNELSQAALPATYFRIFDSYTDLGSGTAAFSRAVPDGVSGDCLLFVYKDADDDAKFAKLVIYFRAPDVANEGAIRRVVTIFSPSANGPVTSLIPALGDPAGYPPVVSLVRGLANGKLFTNTGDRSVTVNGEFIRAGTGQFRRASRTFTFSVTPRS